MRGGNTATLPLNKSRRLCGIDGFRCALPILRKVTFVTRVANGWAQRTAQARAVRPPRRLDAKLTCRSRSLHGHRRRLRAVLQTGACDATSLPSSPADWRTRPACALPVPSLGDRPICGCAPGQVSAPWRGRHDSRHRYRSCHFLPSRTRHAVRCRSSGAWGAGAAGFAGRFATILYHPGACRRGKSRCPRLTDPPAVFACCCHLA